MRILWNKLTFWLDRKPSKVPFASRVFAYVLDWVIGGILCGLPAVAIYSMVTERDDMFSDLYVFAALGFPKWWGYVAGLLCLVVAVIYFVYIPCKVYPGQTLGKKIMKLKIVRLDWQPLDIKTLVLRNIVGLLLIESVSMIVSRYLRQMLTLATGIYFEYYLTAIGAVLTIISGVMVYNTGSRRAIHDYIAKTTVVGIEEEAPVPKNRKERRKKRNKHA